MILSSISLLYLLLARARSCHSTGIVVINISSDDDDDEDKFINHFSIRALCLPHFINDSIQY